MSGRAVKAILRTISVNKQSVAEMLRTAYSPKKAKLFVVWMNSPAFQHFGRILLLLPPAGSDHHKHQGGYTDADSKQHAACDDFLEKQGAYED